MKKVSNNGLSPIANPCALASHNPELVRSVVANMNIKDENDLKFFSVSLNRHKITQQELEHGFLEAYSDHMTPASGIEFKHIYKHIKLLREEENSPYRVFDGGTY